MVMFRDFVRRGASRLGVAGFVRNDADGSVLIVGEGEGKVLQEFIELLKRGSLLARVDNIAVEWQEPSGEFKAFTITY